MPESSFVFYGLTLVVVAGVILSTTLPDQKRGRRFLGLALLFYVGLLYFIHLNSSSLILSTLSLVLLFIIVSLQKPGESQSSAENPKLRLLTWIILGSLLLILTMILKNTTWRPPVQENPPTRSEVFSQYGVLLLFIAFSAISSLLWFKTKAND